MVIKEYTCGRIYKDPFFTFACNQKISQYRFIRICIVHNITSDLKGLFCIQCPFFRNLVFYAIPEKIGFISYC